MRLKQLAQLVQRLTLQQHTQSRLALIIEVGQLSNTNMGEVLRAQSQELPRLITHRFQRELMGQIEVLIAQLGKVALVESGRLIALWDALQLQQSRLSHKDGLYLKQVIAVFTYGMQRHVECPLLEGLTIDSKAIVAGQSHEVGILPRAVTLVHPFLDSLRLLLQTFCLQGRHPRVDGKSCEVWDDAITRGILIIVQQFFVVLLQDLRNLKHQLRQIVTIQGLHIHIGQRHHMQHHIIITRIAVMPVAIPVTGLEVNLHVARPGGTANLHLGIKKVWTSIAVVQSGVQNLYDASVCRLQFRERQQLVFPDVVKQFFHCLRFCACKGNKKNFIHKKTESKIRFGFTLMIFFLISFLLVYSA